jgi:hypothetical protein
VLLVQFDLESGFAECAHSPPIGLLRGAASSSVNWDEERERVVGTSSVRERGGNSSLVSPPVGEWRSSMGTISRLAPPVP